MNSGKPKPMMADSENSGVTHTGRAHSMLTADHVSASALAAIAIPIPRTPTTP